MSEELVTVITFSYLHETFIYESRLESEGIRCFFADKETVTIDPLVSNAIGGIKLKVRVEDAENALKIINEVKENLKESEIEHEILIDGKKYEKVLEECPKCNSDKIYAMKQSFFKSLIGSTSDIQLICLDCNHKWR